ncbi:unnamed protein product, partial [marine sediment metagenome]
YTFSHWVKDGVYAGDLVPYSIVMDADHNLHAVFTGELPEEILDLYIIDEKEMKSIPGAIIVDGTYYSWTETKKRLMLIAGTHTFEVIVPAGWTFSRWESLGGDGWTAVELLDPYVNPTTGITKGDAFLRAYLIPPEEVPPVEIGLPEIATAGIAITDAALVVAYLLLKHFKVIE